MALRKMKDPNVDISDEELVKSREEMEEEATLDISDAEIEPPKPKGVPLDLSAVETIEEKKLKEKPLDLSHVEGIAVEPDITKNDVPSRLVQTKSEQVPRSKPLQFELEQTEHDEQIGQETRKKELKNLELSKSEHRLEFEERLKRLDKDKDIHEKAEELGFRKTDKPKEKVTETLPKQLKQTEHDLKQQLKELKLKLAIVKKEKEIDDIIKKEDDPSASSPRFDSEQGGNRGKVRDDKEVEDINNRGDQGDLGDRGNKESVPSTDSTLQSDSGQAGSPQANSGQVRDVKLIKEINEEKLTKKLVFPDGFLWGTATSAYQVEGGIKNDWSQWEKKRVKTNKFKNSDKKKEDFICGQACDSYNRWEEDLDLAKKLNNNSIRLGLEWARLQPKRKTWDVEAIEHYRELLKGAKARGLTTIVTLWHWTIPTWFATEDGWEKKKNVDYFIQYVDLITKEFGPLIDYWVILNEPMMYVFGGYLKGYHPPGKRKPRLAEKVMKNLVTSHKQSFQLIKKHFPQSKIGYSAMLNYFDAADRWNLVEAGMAKMLHYYWNHRFIKKTEGYFDYLGVNYYFHDRIVWYPPFRINKNEWVTDKGWEIYPRGIYEVLKYAKRFRKPIIITENGLADAEDKHREKFIKEHLRYVHQAIEEGVDARGYMHWSLIDNFEWSYGWEPKFGLYEVDRKTFKRTARPSAKYYKKICKNNAVMVD